jgi:hypothetical protein
VSPSLPALANLLYAYLEGPYWFRDGEWTSADVEMALATLGMRKPGPGYDDGYPEPSDDDAGEEWKRGGR